jgi:hypothetical protein
MTRTFAGSLRLIAARPPRARAAHNRVSADPPASIATFAATAGGRGRRHRRPGSSKPEFEAGLPVPRSPVSIAVRLKNSPRAPAGPPGPPGPGPGPAAETLIPVRRRRHNREAPRHSLGRTGWFGPSGAVQPSLP